MMRRGPAAARSGDRRIGVLPLLAAAAVILVTSLLGGWQLSRGHEKTARAERLRLLAQADPIEVTVQASLPDSGMVERRVKVRGRFDRAHIVLLENRPHVQGEVSRAGFLVLTPLILEPSGELPREQQRAVLVMRGWLPRDPQDRTKIAPFATPEDLVDLEGVAIAAAPRVYSLGGAAGEAGHAIRLNVETAAFAREIGVPLHPFVLQQHTDTADGLLRDWPAADLGADRHYGYAFQWFGLAALTLVWAVVLAWRRRRANAGHGA